MFAEKLDNALAQASADRPPRPFPNLRAKETVRTIVTNLVETINHCPSMSEQSKMAFVLGYVRGAIGVLRIECEDQDVQFSALPHLLDMLDTLNQGGVRALRTLAENVAGAELLEAEEKARIDSLLPSIETLGPEWQTGVAEFSGLGSDECTCRACRSTRETGQVYSEHVRTNR